MYPFTKPKPEPVKPTPKIIGVAIKLVTETTFQSAGFTYKQVEISTAQPPSPFYSHNSFQPYNQRPLFEYHKESDEQKPAKKTEAWSVECYDVYDNGLENKTSTIQAKDAKNAKEIYDEMVKAKGYYKRNVVEETVVQ